MSDYLKQSIRARCLHWLAHGTCNVPDCTLQTDSRPWLNHLAGYSIDGNPNQMKAFPMLLLRENVGELMRWTEMLGLDFEISCGESPYVVITFRCPSE